MIWPRLVHPWNILKHPETSQASTASAWFEHQVASFSHPAPDKSSLDPSPNLAPENRTVLSWVSSGHVRRSRATVENWCLKIGGLPWVYRRSPREKGKMMRILVVFKEISRQWNTLFAEKAMFFHGNETRNLQRKPCGFPGDISLGCPRRQQVFVGSVEVRHVGMWPLLPGQRTHFCWWFSTQPRVFSHVQYIIHIFSVLYIFFWILYLLHTSIYYSIYLLYIDIHIFYRWGVIGFTIPNLKIFIGTVNHQDIWVVDYYLLT